MRAFGEVLVENKKSSNVGHLAPEKTSRDHGCSRKSGI